MAEACARRGSRPRIYRWTFELRRDERRGLELYFFYRDPGARSPYVLERDP